MKRIEHCTIGAVGAAFFMALGSLLTHNGLSAASAKSSAPARGYYLTSSTWDGAHATAACVTGYHMASIWEIHEPSNLRYDGTLGYTLADSGSGPAVQGGWIRTGAGASDGTSGGYDFVGGFNCNAWTGNSSSQHGSWAGLGVAWSNPPASIIPWRGNETTCDQLLPVWCVQD